MAASVVDLPEPVGPVTSTRPRGSIADLLEDLRRIQVLERQDLRRNGAEHRAGAAVLVEGVDAEARQLRDLEREVGLQELLVGLALLVVHDVVHHVVHLLVVQRRQVDALAHRHRHGSSAARRPTGAGRTPCS